MIQRKSKDMSRNRQGNTRHSTLHLAYSFSCNLACGHCIFRCGPDVRGTMGIGRARAFIDQAGRAGIRRIVFTGGEPFLHPRALRTLIEHASGVGIESALITNAAWATSRSRTKGYLAHLQSIGLRSMTVSTDRYHLLFVPLERVRGALRAAMELGLDGGVKISRLAHDPVAEGLCRSLRSKAARVFVQEIVPLGRAASLRAAQRLRPATSFTGAGGLAPPILLPSGDLLSCCNLPARDVRSTDYPFVLGNLEKTSLRTLLARRVRDPLLTTLRTRGPGVLFALLAQREPAFRRRVRSLYQSGCDLCFNLFCKPLDKRMLYDTLDRLNRHDRFIPGEFS